MDARLFIPTGDTDRDNVIKVLSRTLVTGRGRGLGFDARERQNFFSARSGKEGMSSMSMFGGGSSPGYNATSSQTPQQLVLVSLSVICLAAVAGGAVWYMNKSRSQTASAAPTSHTSPSGPTSPLMSPLQLNSSAQSVARGLDGRYTVTYGDLGLRVNTTSCNSGNVWFDNTTEGMGHQWNLRTVPGFEDVYFIRSEDRSFDKGCDRAYLSAPSSCTGFVSLERPNNSDRQFWQLVPSTTQNGGFEIRSVYCGKKRWPSFMISSGTQGGVANAPRLSARDGSSYTLRRAVPS